MADEITFHQERYLRPVQVGIINEAIAKFFAKKRTMKNVKGCGYQIPMGGGKTITSFATAMVAGNERGTLFVCEKSLLQNAISELEKLNKMIRASNKKLKAEAKKTGVEPELDEELTYFAAHQDFHDGHFNPTVRLTDEDGEPAFYDFVITSKEVVSSEYKRLELSEWLITEVNNEIEGVNFKTKTFAYAFDKESETRDHPKPIKNGGMIFGKRWSMVIVDEMHKYLNIPTQTARAFCCIPGDKKLALSGTLFDNPTPPKVLTYMTFIENDDWPFTIPDTSQIISGKQMINGKRFGGVDDFMVSRTEDEMEIVVEYNEKVIFVAMSESEKIIYKIFQDIMVVIINRKKLAKERKAPGDNTVKILNTMILVLILYVRECLIAPIIPVSSIYLKSLEREDKELHEMVNNSFKDKNIYSHFDMPSSILSQRIRKAIEIANLPTSKKVVIFTCYRKTIDLMKYALRKSDRTIETMESSMKAGERGDLLGNLSNDDNFILMLTYLIGSTGLNLQFADTVICMDYDFSSANTKQAVKRVVRSGQTQNVNVYYLCSDTYLESVILEKHVCKTVREGEIRKGVLKSGIEKIDTDELCELVAAEKTMTNIQRAAMKKKTQDTFASVGVDVTETEVNITEIDTQMDNPKNQKKFGDMITDFTKRSNVIGDFSDTEA